MDLSFWRDVAVVVLAVEMFVVTLVPLVLFFFGIKGVRYANRQARTYGQRARDGWQQIHRRVADVTRGVEAPFREMDNIWQAIRGER